MLAEVDLDSAGAYVDHHLPQPGYVCLGCGAPAFDIGEVPAERAAEAEQEEAEAFAASARDVLCPTCETLVTIVPGEECPNCGAALEVA